MNHTDECAVCGNGPASVCQTCAELCRNCEPLRQAEAERDLLGQKLHEMTELATTCYRCDKRSVSGVYTVCDNCLTRNAMCDGCEKPADGMQLCMDCSADGEAEEQKRIGYIEDLEADLSKALAASDNRYMITDDMWETACFERDKAIAERDEARRMMDDCSDFMRSHGILYPACRCGAVQIKACRCQMVCETGDAKSDSATRIANLQLITSIGETQAALERIAELRAALEEIAGPNGDPSIARKALAVDDDK